MLTTSGTSTAATPAAHSSLTVTAPARQTITSQSARRCAMSSMNGSTSASTFASAYPACTLAWWVWPVWCVTTGRCAESSSASACGMHSFSAFAPRLPPTTNTRSRPLRPANRCAGSGRFSISVRTGLPVTTARFTRFAASPSNPNATASATGSSALLLISSDASALTSISGLLSSEAISPPGKHT